MASSSSTPPTKTASRGSKLRRRQTYSDSCSDNPMLRDEEANLELMKPPVVPDELKVFLREIAYPPEEEIEDKGGNYQALKAALKGVKSRVNTGSFKGRSKRRPAHLEDDGNQSDNGSPRSPSCHENEEDLSDDNESPDVGLGVRRKEAKFSEYEMAVLWSQFKDKFPGGKMNNLQLTQMLRQVFPRCDHDHLEHVVENIRSIFDPHETGTISFRDLLIAFSLSMKGPLKDKLQWSYRLYDEEGNGKIDKDDLVETITRLCEFTKNANAYLRYEKSKGKSHTSSEVQKKHVMPTSAKKPVKAAVFAEDEQQQSTGSKGRKPVRTGLEEELSNVKILSNRLGERVGASKQMKKKQLHEAALLAKAEFLTHPQDEKAEERLRFVATLDAEEKKRALEVVQYLDADGDGFVTQDEFVQGCLEDEEFFGIASCFQGHLIWGDLL